MKQSDYNKLKEAIERAVVSHSEGIKEYEKVGLSDRRLVWDLLHFSKFPTKDLFVYLNDSYIETALKKILSEIKEKQNE